jgi:ABC-type Zn2+ transport system substrate-binding protein/surface adhesin
MSHTHTHTHTHTSKQADKHQHRFEGSVTMKELTWLVLVRPGGRPAEIIAVKSIVVTAAHQAACSQLNVSKSVSLGI